GALQRPADNDTADGAGNCGHGAAGPEQCQADDDHDLAPDPVGEKAEWNLQQTLGQSVDTERFADQVGIGAGQRAGISGKHRLDQEQAKKPDRKPSGERRSGAEFLRFHYGCSAYDKWTADKWRRWPTSCSHPPNRSIAAACPAAGIALYSRPIQAQQPS